MSVVEKIYENYMRVTVPLGIYPIGKSYYSPWANIVIDWIKERSDLHEGIVAQVSYINALADLIFFQDNNNPGSGNNKSYLPYESVINVKSLKYLIRVQKNILNQINLEEDKDNLHGLEQLLVNGFFLESGLDYSTYYILKLIELYKQNNPDNETSIDKTVKKIIDQSISMVKNAKLASEIKINMVKNLESVLIRLGFLTEDELEEFNLLVNDPLIQIPNDVNVYDAYIGNKSIDSFSIRPLIFALLNMDDVNIEGSDSKYRVILNEIENEFGEYLLSFLMNKSKSEILEWIMWEYELNQQMATKLYEILFSDNDNDNDNDNDYYYYDDDDDNDDDDDDDDDNDDDGFDNPYGRLPV